MKHLLITIIGAGDLLNWYAGKTYIGTGVSVRFDEDPRKNLPSIMFHRVRVVE